MNHEASMDIQANETNMSADRGNDFAGDRFFSLLRQEYAENWPFLMKELKETYESLFSLLRSYIDPTITEDQEAARVEELAHRYHELAVEKEPALTKDVQEISALTGGRLAHLAKCVKEEDSLKRKLDKVTKEKYITPDEAIEDFFDCVRYTNVSPNEGFTEHFHAFRKELMNRGYVIVRVKNTLMDPARSYRGINTYVQDPGGYWFEIQFHTEESYEALRANHKLYREQREVTTPQERKEEIAQLMMDASSKVPVPEGCDTIRQYQLEK